MKKQSRFLAWLNGELSFPLKTDLAGRSPGKETKRRAGMPEQRKMDRFSRVYAVLCAAVCLALLLTLLALAMDMPRFGSEENPTVNEVSDHYVGSAEHETGAENVIAGMILNYRGFDTFGESCVLFLAVCCVMQLLWNTGGGKKQGVSFGGADAILCQVSRLLLPCVRCFGLCVLFNGHTSPGGGFFLAVTEELSQ